MIGPIYSFFLNINLSDFELFDIPVVWEEKGKIARCTITGIDYQLQVRKVLDNYRIVRVPDDSFIDRYDLVRFHPDNQTISFYFWLRRILHTVIRFFQILCVGISLFELYNNFFHPFRVIDCLIILLSIILFEIGSYFMRWTERGFTYQYYKNHIAPRLTEIE